MRTSRRGAGLALALAFVLASALLLCVFPAGATPVARAAGTPEAAVLPGSAGDPAVTVGWLNEVFAPRMLTEAETRIAAALEARAGGPYNALRQKLNGQLAAALVSPAFINAVSARVSALETGKSGSVRALKGEKMTVAPGVRVMLHQGAALLTGNGAVDLTAGVELSGATGIPGRHSVVFTEEPGGTLEFTMDSTVMVYGPYRLQPLYAVKYGDMAAALNAMGLMLGDGKGYYALERGATRIEGLVLMIRMVGDDAAALACTGGHPLTDIPSWADRYMAYAWQKGWAQGTGNNLFAPDRPIGSGEFMTLLLHAMDYDDSDFSWDQSLAYAERIGVITARERGMLQNECRRDQLAYMAYYALDGVCKPGGTLLEKLIAKGAFTEEQARQARAPITRARP